MAALRLCFDTDVLIELLRGTPSVLARFDALPDDALLFTTHVTAYEMLRGAVFSGSAEERQRVSHFLSRFLLLQHTMQSDLLAAEWWAALRRKGTPVPDADIIIAAIARCGMATVVTQNQKHFSRMEGLNVEYW